ncbi:MAG: hypothetical protein Q7T45_26525 [Bradyrhizobium sp.]|nr:hypothetical protein [Bradyrhizobium sp.]MDO8401367.1 hypothetical protein [Bradyrhizobium sp.]
MIKASGRSALILATGLFVCLAGPSQAAPGDDTVTATAKSESATGAPIKLNKYSKPRHSKKVAQRKSSKVALKSSATRKATFVAGDADKASTAIPPSIANANAQLASAEAPAGSAMAMSAKANTMLLAAADKPVDAQPAAEAEVVASDQLNDLDRALQQAKPDAKSAASTMTLASVETPASPAAPVMAASKEDSAWDQTSLIGKIFIAFGALLTMASAARMFMA